jgi:hypothetical protein
MGAPGPKKINRYGTAFKLRAVRKIPRRYGPSILTYAQ